MAKKIYISPNGTAKEVKNIYLGVEKIFLTNLAPAMSSTNPYSIGTMSTTHTKYSSHALQLTASDTSALEITAPSKTTCYLDPSHIYYARMEIFQEQVVGNADFYWPIAEPNFFSGKPAATANQWTMVSAVNNRSSFAAGNYQFRLDFNNNKQIGSMWFDGVMLIDLTKAFGAGNEPTKEWCDSNIPYFVGQKGIGEESVNKKIIKVYIGDNNGIARLVYEPSDPYADLLIDFNYIQQNEQYILTDWKGTYNGQPSTKMIVPETNEITIVF